MKKIILGTTCFLALALFSAFAFTQRYKPVQTNGIWWLQNSEGQNIFSLGVCVVEPGSTWDNYDLTNPSYAGFHYYPNHTAWSDDTVNRLTNWNFNTIGAWSDYSNLLAVKNNHLYMTPIIHMGSAAGAPWLDMWDPAVYNLMDSIAKGLIQSLKNDPRIIGYFSDNEMGWWKPALFKWIWDQKTPGTRVRTVDLLRKYYGGDWAKLDSEFEPEGASSFEDLTHRGRLWLRPGAKGIPAVTKVLGMLAERYYSLCKMIIHKYDPGALFLGDRYISNYYPEVAEQAGKYCDVVSTNLNPDWGDGGFVRFHLDSLEALTHRPLMVTEYYMTALENRSGDKDNSSGFPVVKTQAERARGFLNTTLAIARNPALVGAHWFQYYDEPQNGRGDGENYDFGLVDIYNKPYEKLLSAAKSLNLVTAHSEAAPIPVEDSLPPAPPDVDDMTQWNRNAAFVPAQENIPLADLYACWSPDTLSLAIYWHEDRFDDNFYKNGKVPAEDMPTVEVDVPPTNTKWIVRIGEKQAQQVSGPDWSFTQQYGTSSHLILRIPASALGLARFDEQSTVHLQVKLLSETKAYTTRWKVDRKL